MALARERVARLRFSIPRVVNRSFSDFEKFRQSEILWATARRTLHYEERCQSVSVGRVFRVGTDRPSFWPTLLMLCWRFWIGVRRPIRFLAFHCRLFLSSLPWVAVLLSQFSPMRPTSLLVRTASAPLGVRSSPMVSSPFSERLITSRALLRRTCRLSGRVCRTPRELVSLKLVR